MLNLIFFLHCIVSARRQWAGSLRCQLLHVVRGQQDGRHSSQYARGEDKMDGGKTKKKILKKKTNKKNKIIHTPKGPISLSSECLRTLRIWIRQLFWRMLAKISDIKWRLATISNIWANVSESVCERQLATIGDCKQMLATTFAKISNYLPILCHYLWTFETFC